MKKFSDKRAAIERQMKKAYDEVEINRGAYCEACGIYQFDHSHDYPRAPFTWLIANEDNITLLCRKHHLSFENNRLWELPTGAPIFIRMMKLQIEEENPARAQMMWAHLINKFYKTKEQADAEGVNLPDWIAEILHQFEI